MSNILKKFVKFDDEICNFVANGINENTCNSDGVLLNLVRQMRQNIIWSI